MTRVPDGALRPWRTLGGDPTLFAPGSRRVVRGSRGYCPPGWVGIVRLPPSWPAHVGILVAPDQRGRGVGRALAAAATARALDLGRVPQWRAATDNPASRVIARAVGYVEVGRQLSVRPTDPAPEPRG